MQQENSTEVNEKNVFELTGTLTYNPEAEQMRLDVEYLEGQWPFGPHGTVRVACRCVSFAVETT